MHKPRNFNPSILYCFSKFGKNSTRFVVKQIVVIPAVVSLLSVSHRINIST